MRWYTPQSVNATMAVFAVTSMLSATPLPSSSAFQHGVLLSRECEYTQKSVLLVVFPAYKHDHNNYSVVIVVVVVVVVAVAVADILVAVTYPM